MWSKRFFIEIEGHTTLCSQPVPPLSTPSPSQNANLVLKVATLSLQHSNEKRITKRAIFPFNVQAKLPSHAYLFTDADPENTCVYSCIWAVLGITVVTFSPPILKIEV